MDWIQTAIAAFVIAAALFAWLVYTVATAPLIEDDYPQDGTVRLQDAPATPLPPARSTESSSRTTDVAPVASNRLYCSRNVFPQVRITKCSDGLFWYENKIGHTFTPFGVDGTEFWLTREDAGYVNIVAIEDTEAVNG